jgi:hypothetical protein
MSSMGYAGEKLIVILRYKGIILYLFKRCRFILSRFIVWNEEASWLKSCSRNS